MFSEGKLKPCALLAVLIGAPVALAQSVDAGAEALPLRVANPEPAPELIRQGPFEADAGSEAAAPSSSHSPSKSAAAAEAAFQGEAPPPKEEPIRVTAALGGSLRLTYSGATDFPVDSSFQGVTIAPLTTRLRVAPEIYVGRFGLIMEADGVTGSIIGHPAPQLVGDRVPFPVIRPLELRKLYLQYKWDSGAFRVGQQTSQWGLGLLANAGAQDAQPGDFGQQHYGNLTYRALLAARPFFSLGGAWRAVETAFAADLIVRDNFGEYALGDRAWQGVVALRFAKDQDNELGFYGVYRSQRNVEATNGAKATDVFVFDFAGKAEFFKERLRRRQASLWAGFEVVGITGTTTQGRHETAPLLQVRQLGAAGKLNFKVRNLGLLLDVGFASGDQNATDGSIDNFRFDRDYKVGLVLFDHVLGYQSARASVRASDPSLTGVPPEGAELLGTAGSITGAWYLFPRVKLAFADWLDVYGGPLFAFSTAKLTDAFTTRLAGGTPRNSLGASPGGYLGTELDLGLQARWTIYKSLVFRATAEGGLLLPGDAFALPSGGLMGTVLMGRLRLALSI